MRPPSARRPRWGRAVGALSVVAVTLGIAGLAGAFPPDDEVFDISVSPAFADDGTVFAVVGHRLLRSRDGGDRWSELVNGLTDEADPARRVAVAATDGSRVYVLTRTDGVYGSTDAGDSWGPVNGGLDNLDLAELAVSPTSPDTVLAAGSGRGLYRTTDGGAHWDDLRLPDRVTSVAFLPDGEGAVLGRPDGRVMRSDDGGATWRVTFAIEEPASVTAIAVGSAGGGTGEPSGAADAVVIGTDDGRLFRSDDGGRGFDTVVADDLPEETVRSIELLSGSDRSATLWVTSAEGGLFTSTDDGDSFTPRNEGLPVPDEDEATGTAPERATFGPLAATPDGESLFVGGLDGLYRSSDDGRSWDQLDTLTEYLVGVAVSPAFADDGTVVATSYVKGAFLSTDGGDSWTTTNDGIQVEEVGPGNEFAPLRRMHDVVFSPDYATDGTIFTANWVRVLRSTDRGATWQESDVPFAEEPDPNDSQAVLRQFVLAPSPTFAEDQMILAGTRQGDIVRSTEAGDPGSWEVLSTLPSRVRSLALSPEIDEDGIVFAGTIDGVYRSDDSGASWEPTGVFVEYPQSDQPMDPGAHVEVSPAFGDDGTVFAGTDRGLFVSHDGGDEWDEVATGPLTTDSRIEALALSPAFADDGTMLVSTRADGVLRSTDGGATFAVVGTGLLAGNRVIADFDDPTSEPIQFSPAFAEDHTIFAYAQTDLLRSTDSGDSWAVLELPSGAEVRDSLGEFREQASAAASSGGAWIDTPIGKLSVKRALAALAAAALAFGAIQLLARGTDVPRNRRVRIGLEWSLGVLVLTLLVVAG